MIERLRIDVRTRWFVLNNIHSNETEETSKSDGKT